LNGNAVKMAHDSHFHDTQQYVFFGSTQESQESS